ncbi:acyl carrier protein [Mycoplasmopsis iners]|uniref:hypothetical protein n=1 Tax=Mycoplasmopsis iners TaxID=76630 RepID=UPI0004957676|nr:hypothetical protein [Mycoplasmopsis iners]
MNIQDKIIKDLERMSKHSIKPEMLLTEINIDSLDLAEMIYEAEVSFKIRYKDEDLGKLKTVQDFITLTENEMAKI